MKRPLQNTLAFVLGDAGSRLIGFLVTVYLARVLEPSAFGVMNIGLAVLGYLLLAGSPGIQTLETRNVASTRGINERRVGGVLAVRLILALVLWVGVCVVVMLFVRDETVRNIILLYTVALVPLALGLDWFFQGREDFVLVSISRILFALVYGLLVYLLVRSPEHVLATPLALVIGHAVSVCLLVGVYTLRHGRPRLDWNAGQWKEILAANVPVGFANFLAQSVANLPPLIIGIVLTTVEVGVYSASMKLAFLFLMADRVLNALFLPVISRSWASKPGETPQLLAITWKVIAFLVIPLAGIGVALSKALVEIVFGSEYHEAAGILTVLMGYVVLTLLNSVLVNTLIGARLEQSYVRIMAVSTLVLAAAVLILTMIGGITGAAWGVVAGEMISLVLLIRAVEKHAGISLVALSARPVISGVLMSSCLFFLNGINPVVLALLGCSVFAGTMIITKGIGVEEFRYLKERFV